MDHYIIRYYPPRSTFLTDASSEENLAIEKHFEYLKDLLDKDILVLAGRTDDVEFGLFIFKAESETVARAIMQNDPVVEAGVFKGELKLFRLALLGEE